MFTNLKERVRRSLKEQGIAVGVEAIQLQAAPPHLGDVSVCCGPIAKKHGASGQELASNVARALRDLPCVISAEETGMYVNVRLEPSALFSAAVTAASEKNIQTRVSERVMVEFLSPNTNKPLHLGHVRNGAIGASVANLLEARGHTVIRANLVNDRGVHICKSMLAYERYGNGSTPFSAQRKGDHFVGDWYVKFADDLKSDPSLEGQAIDMLKRWEDGDPDVLDLWRRMNAWVYEGFEETYTRYGFHFNVVYYESDLYKLGRDIVRDGLASGILEKSDGAIVYRLLPVEKYGINPDGNPHVVVIMRSNGTSMYITQDIGIAVKKIQDHNLDRSIYVVACEQDHHFKSLFAILEALGYDWAAKCRHLSYQMVELPEGKMKSREGNVVDADDLLDTMTASAKEMILEREGGAGDEEDTARRAETIALSAIKFYLLRFGAQRRVKFDPKSSLAFEGDTGPYLLYTNARIRSLLRKGADQGYPVPVETPLAFIKLGNAEERSLAFALAAFPDEVRIAADNYSPAHLADRLLSLGKSFNRFYKEHPILSDDRDATFERLVLSSAVSESLSWGLRILGIETLEKM